MIDLPTRHQALAYIASPRVFGMDRQGLGAWTVWMTVAGRWLDRQP
jgi:hypothetical protein